MIKKFYSTINGDRWVIRLFKHKDFRKLYKDCMGITEYNHQKNERVITFSDKHRDLDTIRHEITHAYLSYKDFSRTSYGAIEERICEMLGKKLLLMHKVSQRIFLKLHLCSSKR